MIKELRRLNEIFMENDKNGKEIEGKNYLYHQGEKNIIISAPHAVRQVREEGVKAADYLTGPIAIYLAEKLNCSYFVRVCNINDDPNYPIGITLPSIENLYLNELCRILKDHEYKLLIDLHGCMDKHTYDCNIWSNNGKSCDDSIIKIFENSYKKYGMTCGYDDTFVGGQVTRQTMRYTNAFQLEVKKKLRNLKNFNELYGFMNATDEAIGYTYKLKR